MALMVLSRDGWLAPVSEDFLPRLAWHMRSNGDFRDPRELLAERGERLIDNAKIVLKCDELQPKPQVESPYYDAQQAASYLGITVKALYGWVERGKLRKLKGYRGYRFTKEMLDAALRGEVEPITRRRKRR